MTTTIVVEESRRNHPKTFHRLKILCYSIIVIYLIFWHFILEIGPSILNLPLFHYKRHVSQTTTHYSTNQIKVLTSNAQHYVSCDDVT